MQDVITLANFLTLESLEQRCEQFIIEHLEPSNCVEVFSLGDSLANSRIAEEAVGILSASFHQLLLKDKDFYLRLGLDLFKQVVSHPNLILFSQFGTILPRAERTNQLRGLADKFYGVNNLSEGEKEALKALVKGAQRRFDQQEEWVQLSVLGQPGDNPTPVRQVSSSQRIHVKW